MTETTKPETYTDAQATDEAALLFTRKIRRMYPDTFRTVWALLPEGARTALTMAENRADALRAADRGSAGVGITREYPDRWANDEEPIAQTGDS